MNYKNKFIDPMQERCNELIKENFYLKQELDKYKSYTFKKEIDVRIKSKNKKND